MTHWKATNLAYRLSVSNTDSSLVFGPAYNGYDWDIACWDVSKKKKIKIPGGFRIKSKRLR